MKLKWYQVLTKMAYLEVIEGDHRKWAELTGLNLELMVTYVNQVDLQDPFSCILCKQYSFSYVSENMKVLRFLACMEGNNVMLFCFKMVET